jgi:hypothetical protein
MSKESSRSAILAHWFFTNEQWREFLYYEKLEFESRAFVDVRTVMTFGVAILFVLAVIGGAKGGPAVFFLVFIAGGLFLGLCFLIHRLIRKSAEQKMNKQTGEVKVTKLWVDINGAIYDWRGRWSLPTILKDYIYIGEEKMLLLTFISNGSIAVRGRREQIEKKFLVPVQIGKEAEADFVIREITENYFKK